MNRDEIIRMARESGLYHMPGWMTLPEVVANLERFAAIVAAAEREACAKVCESYDDRNPGVSNIGYYLAKQIRERN